MTDPGTSSRTPTPHGSSRDTIRLFLALIVLSLLATDWASNWKVDKLIEINRAPSNSASVERVEPDPTPLITQRHVEDLKRARLRTRPSAS